MKFRVFVSYSSVDQDTADTICDILRDLGIDYFLDRKDIRWGESIDKKIFHGISTSSMLLVIISPASLKSKWVPFEIGQAMGSEKTILPYLTHPSLDVPGYLQGLHYKTTLDEVRDYFEKNTSIEFNSKTTRTNGHTYNKSVKSPTINSSSPKRSQSINKSMLYQCPGCGEKCTASSNEFEKDGVFCSKCKAFVHFNCLIEDMELGRDKGWNWICPICNNLLWVGFKTRYKGKLPSK